MLALVSLSAAVSASIRCRGRQSCFLVMMAAIGATMPLQAGEPLRIAVAANFHATLQQLVEVYTAGSEQAFILSPGSSGSLYAQIRQDAPYALFFSADAERPRRLVAEQRALADSRMTYALGIAVLWSAQPGLIDDAGRVLHSDDFRHLAMADPRHAPYGQAAQQILDSAGVWQPLLAQRRLTRAQSVGQAYSQVATGAAPLGIVALSQVQQADGTIAGSWWIPPAQTYSPVVQQLVILQRAAADPGQLAAARAFHQWLRGDQARAVIEAAGYGLPPIEDRVPHAEP